MEAWVGNSCQKQCRWIFVAHPRLGWIEADPECIDEEAGDGLNVISISKSSETPSSKFNFNWFFPAIKKYRSTLLWF